MENEPLDCLIVGGGPAGLTAAIYLARFLLKVRVVDEGRSRAGWIPCTRNVSGFPDGISGEELLGRMRDQAEKYGACFTQRPGHPARPADGGFEAEWGEGAATARTVLLATGVRNRRPEMDEELHDEALARGLIRYCPICDGYEVTDRKVGVIGSGSARRGRGAVPARLHRRRHPDRARPRPRASAATTGTASRRTTFALSTGPHAASRSTRTASSSTPPRAITRSTASIRRSARTCTTSWPSRSASRLTDETGCIPIDAHQRTNVVGVYAAGDVVIGLDQISHAMGEGGVAATTIRNDLAKSSGR